MTVLIAKKINIEAEFPQNLTLEEFLRLPENDESYELFDTRSGHLISCIAFARLLSCTSGYGQMVFVLLYFFSLSNRLHSGFARMMISQ